MLIRRTGVGVLVMLLAWPMAGCRTRMVGAKRPIVHAGREQLQGVPFHLTKPVFMLKETPLAGGKSKYALDLQWVGDLENQYTLNVSPALLTSIDFAMGLGAHGELKTTSSASREEITPMIKAIGEFVATGIGAATSLTGAGILRMARGGVSQVTGGQSLVVRLNRMHGDQRLMIWDAAYLPPPGAPLEAYGACKAKKFASAHWRVPTTTERSELQVLAAQLGTTAFSEMLPLLPARRMWLETAKQVILCEQAQLKKPDDLATLLQKLESRLQAASAVRFDRCTRPPMLDALRKFGERVLDPAAQGTEIDALQAAAAGYFPGAAAELDTIRTELRAQVETPKPLADELAMVQALLTADSQWRWHLVQGYEAEMRRWERDAARRQDTTLPAQYALAHNRWLLVIGAQEEGQREAEILALLSKGPRPDQMAATPTARAVRDFALLRDELVEVRKAIMTKRNAVRPSAPPRSERSLQPHLLVRRDGEAADAAWVSQQLEGASEAPEFVLVREKGFQR